MKMAQFVSITLVIILGMFLNTCGQMLSKDEGMSSKSIEEASGTTTATTTTTDNTTETTAPTVSSTYPSDSASSVAPNTSLTVSFSEAMDTTTITTNSSGTSCLGTLQLSSDSFSTCVQMFTSPTASDSNKTFTIKPASNLDFNTTFKLKVTTDAKDSAGNALASDYTHSTGFTTSSTPDTTAPTVFSSSPADSATSVSISSTIAVTFSEAMDATTVTTNTSNTTCSGTLQVSSDSFSSCVQMSASPSMSNSNKTFTVTPSSNLSYSTTYKIRVTTGVKDSADNLLATQFTSNGFKTIGIPFTARTITSSADGARSVYAVDLDGDGDMDVLSASLNDDKIAWYENDGSESFDNRTITSSADEASSAYAVDLDGDGDIDVLSASRMDDKIAWYENLRL